MVAEIGEDGGLALRPIEQGGCSTPDFGEVEVEKKDLKEQGECSVFRRYY